jgi:hypothetical protein
MLVDLCASNYAMYDGFVDGIDGIFKASITYCDKTIIWIMFQKNLIRTLTREKYSHYYNDNIESKWTAIEPIIKNIKVGKFQSFIIIRIEFSIQFVATRTIHCFQGLPLNELASNLTNILKHGLTYTILSYIKTKEK